MLGLACRIALAAILSLLIARDASAHPHVFVTTKAVFVYGSNGALQEIRYAWSFDEMFSSFAAQGLDTNKDGKLSREELQPLAKENVDSLKEFAYFTVAASGKALEFGEPADYWFDTDNKTTLTLHFTLPVKNAPKGSIAIEIYDPTYFVAFSLAEGKPVSLVGAPAGCAVHAKAADNATTGNPSEAFFQQLQAGADYGAQFANRVTVRCP